MKGGNVSGTFVRPGGAPPTSPALREVARKYTVLIEESDEGFAVSVPGLPGCHSQGDTEAEALANIADAIREYLDVIQELAQSAEARQAEVEV
ncbi:MAG: type II toxin-antitoxin system HicB family antitoxin [Planctomycetes bacterium]|nr:type II toxin-antitoxin system HicB family antitoxin [Planctomycetota bacterium]